MNIGIIGAGSIGLLFGSYLAEAKHNITFLVRDPNTPTKLYIEKSNIGQQLIPCKLVYSMDKLDEMDLIIIAVKYHHLHSLKDGLDALPKDIPLLFLQNGLLQLSFAADLKQDTILVGSVLHGAMKKNAQTVQHLGIGVTTIGMWKGEWERVGELFFHHNEHFPVEFSSEIEDVLFKKAMLNSLINPLTTIACVPNGALVQNLTYKTIAKNIYDELMEVFVEWKNRLLWDEVVTLCTNTQYNHSSMLKDYENGRLMELDTIVGAILAEASKRNKKLPILHTFYLLLKEKNKVGERHL
ncbi:ketopantoate reductase family protein [Psychrobacillus lasiicapitis]|uniref:2-dehydropantoate 2-reductase n=1 Tax=Psychrobacillus lasiicapitis TaxID=1636719 RepID=A0A544TER1_9BACI|nr:2-dehydropantoate 2-reductase [Psychrobacillus lasiicapitis]TQR15920.1 2-dehydropantoate 2-reductase [Psychrobacillus lasiicapitis]GGA17021.1 2-dehydropantoate 2-reductase [Psychrobacillus lasiicapitis]